MIELNDLIEIGCKCFALILVTIGFAKLLHRQSAATRHLLWLVSLLGVFVLPFLRFSSVQLEVPISAPQRLTTVPLQDELETRTIPNREVPAHAFDRQRQVEPILKSTSLPVANGVYWSGTGLALLLIAFRQLSLRRLIKAGKPTELGLDTRITGLAVDDLGVPATAGLVRPIIFVPTEFPTWSEEAKQMALLHEMAHIQRHDWAWNLLAEIICAFHWFNPLVWYAFGQLKAESELACDNQVLRAGISGHAYGTELLHIAKAARPVRAVVSMARTPRIAFRLREIVSTQDRSPLNWKSTSVTLVVGSTAVLLFGIARPAASQDQQKQVPAAVAVQAPTGDGWHGPLRVLVVDSDGRSLKGAHIMVLLGGPNVMGTTAPPDGLTDRNGHYVIRPASFAVDEQRPFGFTHQMSIEGVTAYLPGLQPEFVVVREHQSSVTVRLHRKGVRVEVPFTTTTGQPAVGVKVSVRNFVPGTFAKHEATTTLSINRGWTKYFQATTNEQGVAVFEDCPAGYKIEFDSVDDRYCKLPWYGAKRVIGSKVVQPVVLTRMGTIEGVVHTSGSTQAVAAQATNVIQTTHNVRNTRVAKIDPNGHFLLTDVYPGEYFVFANSKSAQVTPAVEGLKLSEGDHLKGIELSTADLSVRVTGTVRLRSGSPYTKGLQIGCDRSHSPLLSSTNGCTDVGPDGKFDFLIPAGRHTLFVLSISDSRLSPTIDVDGKAGDHLKADFIVPDRW